MSGKDDEISPHEIVAMADEIEKTFKKLIVKYIPNDYVFELAVNPFAERLNNPAIFSYWTAPYKLLDELNGRGLFQGVTKSKWRELLLKSAERPENKFDRTGKKKQTTTKGDRSAKAKEFYTHVAKHKIDLSQSLNGILIDCEVTGFNIARATISKYLNLHGRPNKIFRPR